MILFSRYNDKYELKELESGDLFFKYIPHMRELQNDDRSVFAIDPPGGPFMAVNSFIINGEILTSINRGKFGYFLHFEPSDELNELRGLNENDIY